MQSKVGLGIVVANDENGKTVKVLTTKSGSDRKTFTGKKGKVGNFVEVVRTPQGEHLPRTNAYDTMYIVTVDDDDFQWLNPRFIDLTSTYLHSHDSPYKVVGHIKGEIDARVLMDLMDVAHRATIRDAKASIKYRGEPSDWFNRPQARATQDAAMGESTVAEKVCFCLLMILLMMGLTCSRRVLSHSILKTTRKSCRTRTSRRSRRRTGRRLPDTTRRRAFLLRSSQSSRDLGLNMVMGCEMLGKERMPF